MRRTHDRRGDIQGLRALAVLAVIAFHATRHPGSGWLGVDVFFVVSGFVITATLVRRARHYGRVRLGDFWLRRARRILPMSVVVILVTLLAASKLYAPARFEAIRLDGFWAAVFGANLRFWRTGSDYFTATGSPSPLLHYWSLAVEEQFYLAYPLVALLALGSVRARRHAAAHPHRAQGHNTDRLRTVLVLVLVASLGYAAWASVAHPVQAYYLPFSRAWELALGCLMAVLPRVRGALARGLSWGGTAVVALQLLAPDLGWATPVPAALVACGATAAVLTAHARNPVLDNPVLRWLGDRSFSLYLWHLPVLVLGARIWGTGPRGTGLALVTTLVLSAIGYRLVEHPMMRAPLQGSERDWASWWRHERRGMAASAGALALLLVGTMASAKAAPGWWATEASGPASSVGERSPGAAAPDPALTTTAGPADGSGMTSAPTGADPASGTGAAARTAGGSGTSTFTSAPTATAAPGTSTATASSGATSTRQSSRPAGTTAPSGTTAQSDTPQPPQPGLGATGQQLQDGLRGGLGLTSWPAGLYPGTGAGAAGEAPDWAGYAACQATQVWDPNACTYGRSAGPEIVVYGDSLGINLLSTVVTAYGDQYRVRGLTKLACAVNGVDANFGQPEWRIPCDDHRKAVIAYVKKARPRALIMTEHYTWSIKLLDGATGRAREDEWTRADQAFVDAVRPYVGDVILVAPSIPGVDFYDCYVPGGSPRACTHTVPDWFASTQRAETRVRGVTFVDTRHWYCVDGLCPMVSTLGRTGATRIKLDYVHVSYAYDRLLAADLRWRLRQLGVGL